MMSYLERLSLPRLLKAAFIPVLLLTFLAVSSQLLHEQEPEAQQASLERYEHKMAQPARTHSSQIHYIPSVRQAHPENILALWPEASAPLLCISVFSVIYIILKRLLLYPLKYNSHFIRM
ncbi:hypothetical protein [Paenibacillus sp. MMS20-IR301]|uniref:hypothetical protein n=1 Tax=Paenibacillus sp. MMS20-IR301 TaxID=2895946 RepID=UPI0028E3FEEF|nr:hypothetical protein [Paenibacillus sp. MMS20-IR301]WNS45739.1 hypothetical protein LOS79_10860 [Paenibacillus sp. MMS20-IR301]